MTLEEHLKSVADAIREKTGSTGAIKASDFPKAIGDIATVGGDSHAILIDETLGSGTDPISYTKTVTGLSSIKHMIVLVMYVNASTGKRNVSWAAYIDGETTVSSSIVTLSLSNNSFTFKVNCTRNSVLDPSLQCLAVGEAA